ncbi:hypothetical protein SLS58_004148 [Diplodia intermedia]|uniref:Uncharacterized protein n=1 Tax=Diplodia intermedia TaxID=856260 RepID=A0ABR3TU23_9PEZI
MALRMLMAALLLYPILAFAATAAATAPDTTPFYSIYSTPKVTPSTLHYELTAASNDSPVLSQTNCPESGPDKESGICGNKCMRQYLTTKLLDPVTYIGNDSVIHTATVLWTREHWGDAGASHVPLAGQAFEHERTRGIPPSEASELVKGMWNDGKLDTMAEPVTIAAYKPTRALVPSNRCTPDQTVHTPVASYDPHVGLFSASVTPSNPACDQVDPAGFDTNERLWMYQNKKHNRIQNKKADHEDLTNKHIECWNYESCWDHCKDQSVRKRRLVKILLGVLGALAGAALAAVIIKVVMNRKKNKKMDREAQRKKWGNEPRPAATQNVDGSMDGAADVAASVEDEERARRAAASFKIMFNRTTLNRRDADASGSDTAPPQDEGAVMRRAY